MGRFFSDRPELHETSFWDRVGLILCWCCVVGIFSAPVLVAILLLLGVL